MSLFDKDAFLSSTVSTTFDTAAPLVPETPPDKENGYVLFIRKVDLREGVGDRGPWASINLECEVQDEWVREQMLYPEGTYPIIYHSIFLDLLEKGGKWQMDDRKGKNWRLGIVRDALGQNVPGQDWQPVMMEGETFRALVRHQMNKKDNSQVDAVLYKIAAL